MTKKFLMIRRVEILMELLKGENNIRNISRDSDTMYVYALVVLKEFENEKLVISEKKGRIRTYQLTEKGKKAAALIEEILDLTGTDKSSNKPKKVSSTKGSNVDSEDIVQNNIGD